MIISIFAHCRDCCSVNVENNRKTIFEHDGYVPSFIPGGGDDVELEIDNQTGQILNWKPVTKEVLQDFVEEKTKSCETCGAEYGECYDQPRCPFSFDE